MSLTAPNPLAAAAQFGVDLIKTGEPGPAFFNAAVALNPVAQGLLAAFNIADKLGLVNHGTEPSDKNKEIFRRIGVTGRQYADLTIAAEDDGLSPRVAMGAAAKHPLVQHLYREITGRHRRYKISDALRDAIEHRNWLVCYDDRRLERRGAAPRRRIIAEALGIRPHTCP